LSIGLLTCLIIGGLKYSKPLLEIAYSINSCQAGAATKPPEAPPLKIGV